MNRRHRMAGRWLAASAVAAMLAVSGYADAAVTSSPRAGRISTIAGGIGGPGRGTTVNVTSCGAAVTGGHVFVADLAGSVREINARTDWLRTVAGRGPADSGDGGPAIKAGIARPCGLVLGPAGNLAIGDVWRIRMIAGRSGTFFGRAMTAGDIYTVAGNGACCAHRGDGGLATSAEVQVDVAAGVAFDRWGNLVIADEGSDRVRVVAARSGTFYGQAMTVGHIYAVAGNGLGVAFYGDGGPARNAGMFIAVGSGLAADDAGDVAISDSGNGRVRYVAERNGTFFGVRMRAGRIYTVAGDGVCCGGPPGDGGPAASASVAPSGLAFDRAGNLLVVDASRGRVRVLPVRNGRFYGRQMKAGNIYPLAYGRAGGNGAPASRAGLGAPFAVTFDGAGNVVISDGDRLRVLAERSGFFYGRSMTSGHIYDATASSVGFSGGGGPATAAELSAPFSAAVDPAGDIAVATDYSNDLFRIWLMPARTGRLFGQVMSKGDIYPIASPAGLVGAVARDLAGNVLYTNPEADQVLVIAARSGRFYGQNMKAGGSYQVGRGTIVGPGQRPTGVAVDGAGGIAVGDGIRVRFLAARTGTFFGTAMTAGHGYVLAGGRRIGYSGDGGPGYGAKINGDQIGLDRAGNLLLADSGNDRVRVVARQSGTYYGRAMTAGHIYTVAGDGTAGFVGDGGPATLAEISGPSSVTTDGTGNLLIADTGNNRIRVLAARSGTFYGVPMTGGDIYTVAGSAATGFAGDGGPASSAALSGPMGVAVTPAGDLLICDSGNVRLRMVTG